MALTLYAVVCIVCLAGCGAFEAEMFTADIRSISQCNGENASTKLENFVVDRMEGNNFEMNGTLIIKENILGKINIICTAERCLSEDKPDSCEYHTSYKLENFCEQIEDPEKAWGKFLDNAGIERKCPLKQGEYHITKYPVTLETLRLLALSRPYRVFWKLSVTLDAPNFPGFFCLRLICSLEPKNKLKRNRKPKKSAL